MQPGKDLGGYNLQQYQKFTPEQMQLFKSLFDQLGGGSFLQQLMSDEGIFEEYEKPALRQFDELQGQIASRFSGAGMGGRHGSGFKLATSQAAKEFAEDLASQRLGIKNQALKDLMGFSESLLGQQPYQQFLTEPEQEKSSFWSQVMGGLIPGAAAAAGGFIGAPYGLGLKGAKLGAKLGSGFSEGFM